METKDLHPDIVKFLAVCDSAMEDRLLTHRFIAHTSWNGRTGQRLAGCLTGLAFGVWEGQEATRRIERFSRTYGAGSMGVSGYFDYTCDKYGVDVVGAAIRQQILENRRKVQDWDEALEWDRALDERTAWVDRVFAENRSIKEEEAVSV